MAEQRQLETLVQELIEVLQLQARETEKLAAHVEQMTTRMLGGHEFSVVRSELAALHVRIRKLHEEPGSPSL